MKINRVFVISPPFYSHFNPLLALAKGFKEKGVETIIGCSIEFKDAILSAGLGFHEVSISKNRNTGKAEQTVQPESETKRLEEFFAATRKGAIDTLIVQSEHRKADMLVDPEEMIGHLQDIHASYSSDLYIVDILSYGVTLSLLALDLPFVTFCPPHPYTIPPKEGFYGIPRRWPDGIQVETSKLEALKGISQTTQKEFTDAFTQTLTKYNQHEKKIDNAFRAVSEKAILYNYLDFHGDEHKRTDPLEIYMGHAFEEYPLEETWKKRMETTHPVILITLGTFLSNRVDVLEKSIQACLAYNPHATLIVSAGKNVEQLRQYESDSVFIEAFIPQISLLPHVDLVLFHGGCNTFTETIYYGKPMIVLPFSSDQFNIARDVQETGLGQVLDPNYMTQEELRAAVAHALETENPALLTWQKDSLRKGPVYAVEQLLQGLAAE